jgi:hypothetical protein
LIASCERFDPQKLPDGGIPPYHPGCGCLVVPDRAECGPSIEEGKRESERLMEERAKGWSPQARALWEQQKRRKGKERTP